MAGQVPFVLHKSFDTVKVLRRMEGPRLEAVAASAMRGPARGEGETRGPGQADTEGHLFEQRSLLSARWRRTAIGSLLNALKLRLCVRHAPRARSRVPARTPTPLARLASSPSALEPSGTCGCAVRLQIGLRRSSCGVPACPRRTFAGAFGGLVPRHAQRRTGATDLLREIVLRAVGEGGSARSY